MMRPFSLTTRLFIVLSLSSVLIGVSGLAIYQSFFYQYERDRLAVRIATASVRLSKALIKPAKQNDMAGIKAVLSAFAGMPEISCVGLDMEKLDIQAYWPDKACISAQSDIFIHHQPIRQGMRLLGVASVHFTDDFIHENARYFSSVIAGGIGVLLVSLLGIMFVMHRFLVARPLDVILTALSRLGQGWENTAIGDIKTSSEFSAIARNFDEMAERLRETSRTEREQAQQLALQNHEIQQSLNYASIIQEGLTGLDPAFKKSAFDMAFIQDQLSAIGGDYCTGLDLGDAYIVFFADATGHGVPGALATMLLAGSLQHVASMTDKPGDPALWLTLIDRKFTQTLAKTAHHNKTLQLGADAALLYIEKHSGWIRIATAKQPVFIKTDNQINMLTGDKISIGYEDSQKHFTSHSTQLLHPSDCLVICTDGVFDQPGGMRGFGYGKRRLQDLLCQTDLQCDTAQNIANAIFTELSDYAQKYKAVDDRTILVIKPFG